MPTIFKENYTLLRHGKDQGRAFLGYEETASGVVVRYRMEQKTPTGPLFLRDELTFDQNGRLLSALYHKFHRVAPKLQIVRSSLLARGPSGWLLKKQAFGYAWQERLQVRDLGLPMGRLWLVGAQVAARKLLVSGKDSLEFRAFDPDTFKILPLRATARRGAVSVSIRIERPDGRTAELDYDPQRGGPIRLVDWNGTVYQSGASPFAVPAAPEQTNPALVRPFTWPADLPQQEVQIERDGLVLKGSLALPKQGPIRTAILLVPGAGRLDRHGTMGLRKPYADLAAALARAGHAVLRYDKRGVGGSGGRYEATTLAEERRDVLAWIGFLRRHRKTRRAKLVVLAHGEGVYAAAHATARLKAVRGLVLLAPPGRPYDQVLLDRYRREWEFGALPAELVARRTKYLTDSLVSIRGGTFGAQTWLARPEYAVAWLREVLAEDLPRILKRVRRPVLVLRGASDILVTEEDVRLVVRALMGHARVQAPAALPHVGHYLQRTPHLLEIAPEEWLIPSPVDKRVIDWLTRWLAGLR